MNLHNICLLGLTFPLEAARFPNQQRPVWSLVGRAGWAGDCLVDRREWQCRDSLGVSPWETLSGNAAGGCECETFRFHFHRGPCFGTARSLTCSWLVPFSLLQSLLIPLIPVPVCRQKTWCVWPIGGWGLGSGTQYYS